MSPADGRKLMTTATVNVNDLAAFWRAARRLHTIYSELDRTFELGLPACHALESPSDRSEPEIVENVRQWLDHVDNRVQVWQLRQMLQSTNLQSEENLNCLIVRHLEKQVKTEADKEKIDFLLVQYFAHCAPQGLTEDHITLDEVARVLQPALGVAPGKFPAWASQLDEQLRKLNQTNSLEELQDSGALIEARELKQTAGDHYFDPACMVAFTRFNFLARRAFFRAMHVDLHAIRSDVNELESIGYSTLDCREAGLTENESLEQVRHVVHQWKTPFRAPYSGGASFMQLILLRHALRHALEQARRDGAVPRAQRASAPASIMEPVAHAAAPDAIAAAPAIPSPDQQSQAAPEHHDEDDAVGRCVADIRDQLLSMPSKSTPSVSAIVLGGCKLLIATWEAQAFTKDESDAERALQKAVASRTILHVCMDRHKKHEPTDLGFALEIAQQQAGNMDAAIAQAKEAMNIDAAVNLAATKKRLLALMEEAHKLAS